MEIGPCYSPWLHLQLGAFFWIASKLKGKIAAMPKATAGQLMPSTTMLSAVAIARMPPTVLRAFHLRESKYLPSARHPAPELFELIADVKRRASFRGEFFVTMELERTVEDAAERAAEAPDS